MKRQILLFGFTIFCMHLGFAQADAGKDIELCLFDSLYLTGQGLPSGDTGTYQWRDLNSGMIVSNTADYKAKIVSTTARSYELKLEHTKNGQTSTTFDTCKLTVNALPTFVYKGIPSMCYQQCSIALTLNQIVVARAGYDPNITESDLHYYQNKNPSWISGGPAGSKPYVYSVCGNILNSQIPKTGLSDSICYDYMDPKGCYNKECKSIKLNPNPVVELKAGIFCQKAGSVVLNKMVVKPFSKTGGIESFRCLEVPAASGLSTSSVISTVNTNPITYLLDIGTEADTQMTGTYTIEYCFKDGITGCQSCDTTTVNVIQLLRFEFDPNLKSCTNNPVFILDSFLKDGRTGNRIPNSAWRTVAFNGSRNYADPNIAFKLNNSVYSQKLFDPSVGVGSYLLRVTDSANGCTSTDSVYLYVSGLPLVKISVPDTVCSNLSPFRLLNIQPSGPSGKWTGIGVDSGYFNPSKAGKTNWYEKVMLKYEYTNPLTTCTSSDSEVIVVQNIPEISFHVNLVSSNPKTVQHSILPLKFLDSSKAQFLWKFYNNDSSLLYRPNLVVYPDTGVYKYEVSITDNYCTAAYSAFLDLKQLGLDLPQKLQALVYPNPSSTSINIDIKESAQMQIYNQTGLEVFQSNLVGDSTNSFDLGHLSSGVYLLKISNARGVTWTELLISR